MVIKKPEISKSSSWLYTLHIDKRDLFSIWMGEQGIMTSRVHERNDRHTAFKDSVCELPGVDLFNNTQISIPVGWWITNKDRKYIVDKIQQFSDNFINN
jgi:perosamine synthetase